MGVLLRIIAYPLRYKLHLALVYTCLTGATLLALAVPKLLGWTIDSALENGDRTELIYLAILVLVISIARGALAYGQSYLSEFTSQKVAYDIRHDFLARLQSLSFSFHDRQKTGDLMSRATADVESIRWFVNFGMVHSINIILLVLGASVLLLVTDWELALIGLAAVPIAAYIAIRMSRKFRQLWAKVQSDTGHMTTVLQESLSGMRVVKTFGGEDFEKDKFRAAAQKVATETFTINRVHAANSSLLSLLFTFFTALVVWYGGWKIINGTDLTAGELTGFVLYLGLLVMPVRMSGWMVNTFARAISSGERIFAVLDAPSPVEERPGTKDLHRASGEITFESVSFDYRLPDRQDGHPALAGNGETLRSVNLHVRPGQKIAILGTPGSGKSTLVNLIPRFYDVTGGKVTIDGTDVRDLSLESLRRNVGIVFQDVFLFMASMRENISYGIADATLEEIQDAARSAQIHDFIMELPDQYDTLVGERGVTLSGGQRQRVSIARTLLMDPPILILDDSTSSVDMATEDLIRKALAEVMRNRTTFVIAHRISSMRTADIILVLEDGEIAEMGTHEQLATKQGLYREIYRLQLFAEEDFLADSPLGHSSEGG